MQSHAWSISNWDKGWGWLSIQLSLAYCYLYLRGWNIWIILPLCPMVEISYDYLMLVSPHGALKTILCYLPFNPRIGFWGLFGPRREEAVNHLEVCPISPGRPCHLYGKAGNNCKRISDNGIHIYEPSLVTYWIIVLDTLRKSIVRKTKLLQFFPGPTMGVLVYIPSITFYEGKVSWVKKEPKSWVCVFFGPNVRAKIRTVLMYCAYRMKITGFAVSYIPSPILLFAANRCPPVPQITNAEADSILTYNGITLTYTCNKGHIFNNGEFTSSATCNVGNWVYDTNLHCICM